MKTSASPDDSLFGLNSLASSLQRTLGDMESFIGHLQAHPMEGCLRNLETTTERIGASFPRRPVEHRRYAVQWAEFVVGRRKNLDEGTVRYLCWEPVVATDGRFLAYLSISGVKLTRRPLAGLVRSFHWRWGEGINDRSLEQARALISSYDGPNPIILKWKSNLDTIMGPKGPSALGRLLVERDAKLAATMEEWYLDPQSLFVGEIVEAAAASCHERLGSPTRPLIELLFGEILSWPGWKPQRLRRELAELILESSMTVQVRDILQQFIMASRHLGDPRIEANGAKWAEMPQKARNRVMLWLSQNPFGLLEQVYQEGRGWTVRPWGNGGAGEVTGGRRRS